MPVVVPLAASIETVKAVPYRDLLSLTIIGSPRRSIFSGVMERHKSPLPYLVMKLTASGVTFSAAIVRSPSFSRSSSSTSITIRPCLTSSTAASIPTITPIQAILSHSKTDFTGLFSTCRGGATGLWRHLANRPYFGATIKTTRNCKTAKSIMVAPEAELIKRLR